MTKNYGIPPTLIPMKNLDLIRSGIKLSYK